MSDARVRLQDVADEVGLSKAATSYALRGLRGSARTQERVRDAAERLGYRANPAAQALAEGRTGAVGICASLDDLWHQDLAVRLARRLREEGLSTSIADVEADPDCEREVVQAMAENHLDGAIALVIEPSAPWWGDLPEDFRVVAVGDDLPDRPAAASVVFDNAHGVRTALDHLAGLGHRRIALLTTTLPASPGRPAETVASAYAEGSGLDLQVRAVPPASRRAEAEVRELLTAPRDRPTALFCLSDSIAFGAYRAASELGLVVPDDLSVLGFDDHDLADLVDPALTTFGWDTETIVDTAVGHLLALRDDEAPPRTHARPDLVLRASTAAPASVPVSVTRSAGRLSR